MTQWGVHDYLLCMFVTEYNSCFRTSEYCRMSVTRRTKLIQWQTWMEHYLELPRPDERLWFMMAWFVSSILLSTGHTASEYQMKIVHDAFELGINETNANPS